MKIIEREFSRNPIKKGKITSSIGYIYGECARKLWYMSNTNQEGFTKQDIDAMNFGTEKHKEIQENKFPKMLHEYHRERSIPEIYGVNLVGATYDCINDKMIIEIKPRYTRKSLLSNFNRKILFHQHYQFIFMIILKNW